MPPHIPSWAWDGWGGLAVRPSLALAVLETPWKSTPHPPHPQARCSLSPSFGPPLSSGAWWDRWLHTDAMSTDAAESGGSLAASGSRPPHRCPAGAAFCRETLLGLPRGSEVGDTPGGQWSSEAQERPASTSQERLCASFQVLEIPNAIARPHPPWHSVIHIAWHSFIRLRNQLSQ